MHLLYNIRKVFVKIEDVRILVYRYELEDNYETHSRCRR